MKRMDRLELNINFLTQWVHGLAEIVGEMKENNEARKANKLPRRTNKTNGNKLRSNKKRNTTRSNNRATKG